jgi:hypothetical protein
MEQNPKEKAIELVDKYNNSIMSFLSDNMKYQNAIKCALISVDECIKAVESDWSFMEIRMEYWQKVKQEIEKL